MYSENSFIKVIQAMEDHVGSQCAQCMQRIDIPDSKCRSHQRFRVIDYKLDGLYCPSIQKTR